MPAELRVSQLGQEVGALQVQPGYRDQIPGVIARAPCLRPQRVLRSRRTGDSHEGRGGPGHRTPSLLTSGVGLRLPTTTRQFYNSLGRLTGLVESVTRTVTAC